MAAANGNTEAAKLLLDANADPKIKDIDGATALHKCAEKGDTVRNIAFFSTW